MAKRIIAVCLLLFTIFSFCSSFTSSADAAAYVQGEDRLHLNGKVPEKGSVESLIYYEEYKIKYNSLVYLPYGYDPDDKSTAYDVLVILPGASGSWNTYFNEPYTYTGVQIMDELIYTKAVRPLIVVTISSFRTMKVNGPDKMALMMRSLVEAVDANYNTYGNPEITAALDPGEDLRDHYVLAGFCYSADIMASVLLVPCGDLFSRYGFFSTKIICNPPQIKMMRITQKLHPIRLVMTSAGTREPAFESYTNELADEFEKLDVPVVRFSYRFIEHGYADNAFTSFYNILLLMFPAVEDDPAPEKVFSDGAEFSA